MKERPICRKRINQMCEDYGWDLTELHEFTRYDSSCVDWRPIFLLSISDGPKIQLRKMMREQELEAKK